MRADNNSNVSDRIKNLLNLKYDKKYKLDLKEI